jgi:hypothetical protein
MKFAFPFTAALSIAATIQSLSASVIVADTFGGSSSVSLNGSAAPTFEASVVAAGGSGVWSANSAYKANGQLESTAVGLPTPNSSATLSLGTYIWDSRGTESGLFTLTATISGITGGSSEINSRWVSLGFFGSQPSLTSAFWVGNPPIGIATIVHRQEDNGSNNYFSGMGATGGVDPGRLTGTVTYSITVDLRSWDGISNFGTVSFSNSVTSGSTTMNLPNTLTTNQFAYFGFSGNTSMTGDEPNQLSTQGPGANLSNLSLSQIPEPASALLASLALSIFVFRRKTR